MIEMIKNIPVKREEIEKSPQPVSHRQSLHLASRDNLVTLCEYLEERLKEQMDRDISSQSMV